MIGDQIAATAETWVGVPFAWQGRIRSGVDCKGLICAVAKECGRPEAESFEALAGDYGPVVDEGRLLAGLANLFDRVADIQAGDLLLLRMARKAQHLAIACPKEGQPTRAIQAYAGGPFKVVACRTPRASIHSIWRWRD